MDLTGAIARITDSVSTLQASTTSSRPFESRKDGAAARADDQFWRDVVGATGTICRALVIRRRQTHQMDR